MVSEPTSTGDPADTTVEVAAVVLAGGGSRRLGGVDKLALTVGGVGLLDRVLAPLAELGWPAVVVGPRRAVAGGLPEPVWTRESPAGGGPAAGLAAGLAVPGATAGSAAGSPLVAVLAGDLPHLSADALSTVAAAAAREVAVGGAGALAVDGDGIPQLLLGVWSRRALLAAVSGPVSGASVRSVLAPLRPAEVVLCGTPAPWSDCDTAADLAAARGGVATSTMTTP